MWSATLRFYAELNDFLPLSQRYAENPVEFQQGTKLRQLIEGFGVPHTEVELILMNGGSVGLDDSVQDGASISLYPMFEAFDISPLLRLRSRPWREPRFIADAHLGRLARYLRLLGFDTRFENDSGDKALARQAAGERRILLTRDRALLMRREITHGCYIRSQKPLEQVVIVMQRCDLYGQVRPFTRCMVCNGLLEATKKSRVQDALLPQTRKYFDEFWRCTGCGRIYWKGSHFARLNEMLERLRESG